MEEYIKKIEDDLSVPRLPKFKSKEEIIANARYRLATKRGNTVARTVQGNADTITDAESSVRYDQGNGRSSTVNSGGADTEGRPQAHIVHGRDERNEARERGIDGYSGIFAERDRINANGGTSTYKHDRPTSGVGESEIHADKKTRKTGGRVGGFRSKVKTFVDTAFAPIEEPARQASATRSRSASVSSKGAKWRTLSAEEIKVLRPKLVTYLTWQTEHLDNLIIATVSGHDPTIVIWSNMDEDEIEILADFLIEVGRHDVRTAQAVRFASEIVERIKVGIIVLPRIYKTVNLYLARGFDVKIFLRPR